MTKRAPFWLPPISFMAIGLVILFVSVFYQVEPISYVGQLALLLVLLRAFCYWPPIRMWFVAMPGPHRVVFGILLGGMILGHYSLNGRSYFPFVVWEIFPAVHAVDPVTSREFIATRADGSTVRLLVEQQFPSIVQVDPIDSFSPETTEHLARALAAMYNAHHADNPVRAVDLMVMAVQLHPAANESRPLPSCELLNHYDVSSAPSN